MKLHKCTICNYHYRPAAHDNHCPACGTLSADTTPKVVLSATGEYRAIGRGLPVVNIANRALTILKTVE